VYLQKLEFSDCEVFTTFYVLHHSLNQTRRGGSFGWIIPSCLY